MHMSTKPDIDRAIQMWDAYWAGEVLDRPLVVASVPKQGASKITVSNRYHNALAGKHAEQLALIDNWLDSTRFMCEAIPCVGSDLGPDQFAAFLGADLEYSDDSPNTNWVTPIIEDWQDFLPLRFDESNATWQKALQYSRFLARHGEGRFLVSVSDLHSNADALSALRSPERLCLDFYDHPEDIREAMLQVRKLYQSVYDALFEAGRMGGDRGSMGWAPFWCRGKFATIQCDFLALVGPDMARDYILPALEEEADFLDHCVYHLDGPGCLPHLDDLLSIKGIDVIQWVSGDGSAPMHEWLDLLRRCQAKGKGLQIYGVDTEIVKRLAGELRPEGVVYCVNADSEAAVDELASWLSRNT